MSAEDILSRPQPPPDERVAYGADPNQFLEVRLPRAKGPHSVLLNIHGGFWRAKYDLAHAGHLCEALRAAGVATFNIEYRRGGKPDAVPEHYREADPMEFSIPHARQWLLHGSEDDTVPPEFSRDYVMQKKKAGESVQLLEIPHAGHFDLIDPTSEAFKQVKSTVLTAV